MKRPELKGRILLERHGQLYRLSASLEVYGDVFTTPYGDEVDARDAPRRIEYVVNIQPRLYYPPPQSPLPRPSTPYTLVEAALVYTHEPRLRIVQGNESTIVLTAEAYTLVEGPVYSHLGLEAGGMEVTESLLAAYPVVPREPAQLRDYVMLEYEMLERGLSYPHLLAAMTACSRGGICILEDAWRAGRAAARLGLVQREWGEMIGCKVPAPSPVEVRVDGSSLRLSASPSGVVRVQLRCGGEAIALELCVHGYTTRRLDEGCVLERYSTLCPYCWPS